MALQTKLITLRNSLLDLIFPPRCIGCSAEGSFLCESCCTRLPLLEPPYCKRCGIALSEGNLCLRCYKTPPSIEGIRSLFLHQGLARDMIHYLKYRNMKVLAWPLAVLMANYLQSNPLPADILVAVPMDQKRIHVRGYNQSDLLVEQLHNLIGTSTVTGSLVRSKNTTPQVSLGAEARRNNVEGAFRCKDQSFQNRSILLIDDVCTTGATLNACATALKEAGAASVWGLTISREC